MTAMEHTQSLNLVGWVLNPRVGLSMHLRAWVKDPPYMLPPIALSAKESR